MQEFIYKYGIHRLNTGYFSLVMATGIVSLAALYQGFEGISGGLFIFNQLAYLVLWVLLLLRLFLCFEEVKKDMVDHLKGPGFFTLIAGTNVLGTQYFIQGNDYNTAMILWIVGSLLWIFIIYTYLVSITINSENVSLERGINGAWLIATVATQSVAILGTLLAPEISPGKDILLFSMLVMFFIGCMLYIIIISLIFYRFSFFGLKPEQLTAPYWINMGAVAISTLAGSTLLLHADQWVLLSELEVFLKGFTLFFWSIGTWWIPLLIILGIWKHMSRKVFMPWSKSGYDASYWGMVFPLGMYTACTYKLAHVLEIPFLLEIPHYFVYLALAGWLITFAGLLQTLISGLFFPKTEFTTEL